MNPKAKGYILGTYAPDLVLYNGCSCPVDIEIDEPYEYKTKKEIHYMGCGDEERNNYFVKTIGLYCGFRRIKFGVILLNVWI